MTRRRDQQYYLSDGDATVMGARDEDRDRRLPLGETVDGTPRPARRRTGRKAEPAPAVDVGVMCLCGERFGDFREAYVHVRRGRCPVLTNVGELRKANGDRLRAECGTRSGADRHRDLGEEVCPACRQARREVDRAWREANRERVRAIHSAYREAHRERLNALRRARRAAARKAAQ